MCWLMNSRQRLLAALRNEEPDRLPVTTHHLMPYFLETSMNGMSVTDFFDSFRLDPIKWLDSVQPVELSGDFFIDDPAQKHPSSSPLISSENWRISSENRYVQGNKIMRYRIETPVGSLSMTLESNEQTDWVTEPLIKGKSDIDTFARHAPSPVCNVEEVNSEAEKIGDRGIIRGTVPGFDIYGQPGCWQDASVLYGIENLIMETFTDPAWVRRFLTILLDRKKKYMRSLTGARFDIIELGGGSASTTVISPGIFEEFVAPFDTELVNLAHDAGQRIVYHTCGGMMPILERIVEMGIDAMETFTPVSMGGDTDLREAKRRIGNRVCMIGGFDQIRFFRNCNPSETRNAVRTCFREAGEEGGYILAPSDHFFEADISCLKAFSDEAHRCRYDG